MEDYKKKKRLGAGSFGDVWEVEHRITKARYAAKFFDLANSNNDEDSIKDEIANLKEYNDPCLVRYIGDIDLPKEKKKVILLELCEGGELLHVIKSNEKTMQAIPEEQIRGWLIDIARGLAYLHSKNIIHRDIKSSNILLSKQGQAKIADFGTLRLLSHTKSFATTYGGTPYYRAPEQWANKPYTKPIDIWAFGCVLYELCTFHVNTILYAYLAGRH